MGAGLRFGLELSIECTVEWRSNKGFTILELIMVIAIVGLLAAVAMPKFASMDQKARAASYDGVLGGFTTAIQIVHSRWLADGGTGTTVSLDGATVIVNTDGWPTIDPNNAVQNDAPKLYALIMSGSVPPGWGTDETPALDAGTAEYCLAGAGGGNFTYNGLDGTVTPVGACP